MKITQLFCAAFLVMLFVGCESQTTTADSTGTTDHPYVMNEFGLVFDDQAKIMVSDDDALHFGNNSFTITAWVKANFNDYFQDIIVKGTTYPDIDYDLYLDRTNKFRFTLNRSEMLLEDNVTNLESGRYYHVAVVVDQAAGKALMYVNGDEVDSEPIVGTPFKSDNRLLIGGHNTENVPKPQNVKGTVYNVALWKLAKTQGVIRSLMYSLPTGGEADLVAFWPINDGSGKMIKDLTGNHDGTVLGNVRWIKMPF